MTGDGAAAVKQAPGRPVRSFVLRAGRVTAAQERALETLWPRWGIELPEAPVDEHFWSGVFGGGGDRKSVV